MKRSIDPQRLQSALQKLKRKELLVVLERAISHVPQHARAEIVDGFIRFDDLVATDARGKKKPARLVDTVKAFDEATRREEYYDSFNVNSKNYMQKSMGTEEWIVECKRLLDDVLVAAVDGEPADARASFERLFELLRLIDEGKELVFFADDGGSWQVGVDWLKILPAYFRCLSATAQPDEYAQIVRAVVDDFAQLGAPKYLARARAAATKEQKAAMKALGQSLGRG